MYTFTFYPPPKKKKLPPPPLKFFYPPSKKARTPLGQTDKLKLENQQIIDPYEQNEIKRMTTPISSKA